MRGRRSERRTGRCLNEPATPTPLTNEGNLCRDSTKPESSNERPAWLSVLIFLESSVGRMIIGKAQSCEAMTGKERSGTLPVWKEKNSLFIAALFLHTYRSTQVGIDFRWYSLGVVRGRGGLFCFSFQIVIVCLPV